MNLLPTRYADNACWTCRRRRRKCDRLLPACRQCTSAQRQCLGYSTERPLRWTNSVASRGRLMGQAVPNVEIKVPLGRSLIDPGLQDLSLPMRGYIAYFEQFCCQECVVYDSGPTNAFKEFLSLIPSSRGLCHIIASISALYQAQRDVSNQLRQGQLFFTDALVEDGHGNDWLTKQRYHDFLFHKQLALQFLRRECQQASPQDSFGIIASILMFIWSELMESGSHTWVYHLEGLRQIMMRNASDYLSGSAQCLASSFSRLYEYFDTSYAIFEIIGSTLIQSKQSYEPLLMPTSALDILKRSESLTWTGCPAELLYILSLVHSASALDTHAPDVVLDLFCRLEAFSPEQWAILSPLPSHVPNRFRVSSIYQAAICIYMCQVFSFPLGGPYRTPTDANAWLDHTIALFTTMDPQDRYFRALFWPTFVIGAEAQTQTQRKVIMEALHHLWIAWAGAQNVVHAAEVLKEIWGRNSTDGVPPEPWIQFLYERGENWMFV
ncbi:fungal-specific transcription factor domain-containing protein [Aspergillus avenaceus]|uniref:Fungal-specific transcription factor domain-containing protein n=1 Tax=Aspergillus avenaceus TaxID=36643 RepID=A0A5N6U2V3_ASPAV|nr:fungal-specific transcription factor domain-containing protein [Aspergillus avenaceus]